jgi:RNA polymerase sigma factor (sigma-70 family)
MDPMPPPPAEPFAAQIFLGPALRAQPDRRLVKLVREGYETAFEEIVRRYREPLDRFAAAIVGGRSEDVTQDALSKALLALRGTTTEIELKPWLYRIVRNTALNELRDGPPPTEELGDALASGYSAAVEAERREEIGELMERLRALPEPQRAAIVMRELEGLSHEEIAAALGVSGGAARQAIYRARLALRDGLGLLIPLPLLRVLFDHGAEAASAGASGAAAAAGAASAVGGGGATLGGIGAGGALKVGLATAVLAGSVGAGVAIQHDRGGRGPDPAEAAVIRPASSGGFTASGLGGGSRSGQERPRGSGENRGGDGSGTGDDKGRKRDEGDRRHHDGNELDDSSESGPSPSETSGHGGRGPSGGGHAGGDDHFGDDASGGSHSGRRHGPGGGSASGGSGGSGSSGDPGGGHGGGSGSGSGGGGASGGRGAGSDGGSGGESSGSGDGSGSNRDPMATPEPVTSPPPTPEPALEDAGDGSGESGSGSGVSGSGDGGSGGDSDDS